MPKRPSLDDLNARLERASKMLDGCATMIRDNAEIDSANIRNIGDALVAVVEIRYEIYKVRPDLMPDLLKPEPIKALYAEFEVYRSEPALVQMIELANKKSRRLRDLVLAPKILVMPGA